METHKIHDELLRRQVFRIQSIQSLSGVQWETRQALHEHACDNLGFANGPKFWRDPLVLPATGLLGILVGIRIRNGIWVTPRIRNLPDLCGSCRARSLSGIEVCKS